MSNGIYGFAEFFDRPVPTGLLDALRRSTPLGVFPESETCLHGFPPEYRPTHDSFVFAIGDSADWPISEYLLDGLDFDPDAGLSLPARADERVSLLVDLLSRFFDQFKCSRLVVCLTVNDQIDSVKRLSFPQISSVFREDCVRESPPCFLYIVTL